MEKGREETAGRPDNASSVQCTQGRRGCRSLTADRLAEGLGPLTADVGCLIDERRLAVDAGMIGIEGGNRECTERTSENLQPKKC